MESFHSITKTSSLLDSLLCCCHLPSSPQDVRRRSIASVSNRRSFADVVWSWKRLRWRAGRGGGRVGDVERGIRLSVISGISVTNRSSTPTRIPLSEREIYTIVKSWKTIQGRCIETGMKMFVRLFELNPELKETFEKFRMMDTKTGLWKNVFLETHGMVVMNALDEIMTNLDDSATVVELIIEQGRSHARFADELTEHVFWAMEKPFLMAVQETIGDTYTPALQKLYAKTIRFILATLVIGFHQSIPLHVQHSHQPTTSNMSRHNHKEKDHQTIMTTSQ